MKDSKNYFESKNEVKWCPGCGNYAILSAMQKALYSMRLSNNDVIFVSGIGCSGRFPYYINTFGFHTLHGRAIPVATGLKSTKPDIHIWVVVGDGDAFSIGLGHTLHAFRRNVNINILFINNRIYGLTKGQYSPTSSEGSVTKSSLYGSLDYPLNPLLLSLSSGCTFVARSFDNDVKMLELLIKEAMLHNGISFIEVLQNCIVYNDGVYSEVNNKTIKDSRVLYLEDEARLIYGKNKETGIVLSPDLTLSSVDTLSSIDNILLHNTKNENIIQLLLASKNITDIPYPIGIFRKYYKPTYFDKLASKRTNYSNISNLNDLFEYL